MNEPLLFFSKFLRHGTAIASLAPSSPWLSQATIRNIDWKTARVVVELGAGTGPITQVITQNASANCKIITLERDPDFAAILRKRFGAVPNLEVIEGDVRSLQTLLADRKIESVDAIVSGLPVPSFSKDLQKDLFRSIQSVLNPQGSFSQITELPWVYLSFYKKYFEEVRFVFEPRNLPPAGAYHCKGPKPLP